MSNVFGQDWVIVAGGFHDHGAMDRANAALAAHLRRHGARLHLVGHDIDDRFRGDPFVECHDVPRPRGVSPIAETLLSRRGRIVASQVTARARDARVVVNGGNCPWPDINWVHAVHAAWPVCDQGAPPWIKVKHRVIKALARRRERAALRSARVVIANSNATRQALIETGLVEQSRVHVVYLASDDSWGAASLVERQAARTAFGIDQDLPVAAFVGTLGFDLNKGFDVLWSAWKRLASEGSWNAALLVAGGGGRLPFWRRDAARSGLTNRVRFLGVTTRVRDVLAAADLLVSPVRYEAYGLNVQEALCRGTAVMVTKSAGIVERFDDALEDSLLPNDITGDALAERLRAWVTDVDGWRRRAASTAERLGIRSWDDMGSAFVAAAAEAGAGVAGSLAPATHAYRPTEHLSL